MNEDFTEQVSAIYKRIFQRMFLANSA